MPRNTFSLLDDNIIFNEMMVHPALFTHVQPKAIAIYGDNTQGVLKETLKHPTVTEVWHSTSYPDSRSKLLSSNKKMLLDVIIVAEDSPAGSFEDYFSMLNKDGILVLQSSSIFTVAYLKSIIQQLEKSAFTDTQPLAFSQPHFPTGWRSAVMALKNGCFKRIREKDIFNRPFNTFYYNIDTHRAALALPEFIRKELIPEEVN